MASMKACLTRCPLRNSRSITLAIMQHSLKRVLFLRRDSRQNDERSVFAGAGTSSFADLVAFCVEDNIALLAGISTSSDGRFTTPDLRKGDEKGRAHRRQCITIKEGTHLSILKRPPSPSYVSNTCNALPVVNEQVQGGRTPCVAFLPFHPFFVQ